MNKRQENHTAKNYLETKPTDCQKKMSTLSESELARIAKNREKALSIKNAKLIRHPYNRQKNDTDKNQLQPGTTARK